MENGKIKLITPSYFSLTDIRYRGENYLKLQSFPDHSTFRNGVFKFKNCQANIIYALENFPKAEWVGVAKDEAERAAKFIIEQASKKLVKDSHLNNWEEGTNDPDYVSKTKPFKHQLQSFMISKNMEDFALFFEQGCGKTKVIIDNARYLFYTGEIDALVAIAPNGVHDNWIDEEMSVHYAGEWVGKSWRSGFNKAQKREWDLVKINNENKLKVFSFNIEGFTSKKAQEELLEILTKFRCLLVVDESQKIKNPAAKRTKFLCKCRGKAKYRRILTGTPITKGAEDFYSQLQFLNPKILGITSFHAFKQRYCVMGGFENRQVVSYHNIEELQKKVEDNSMRVLKRDCLDLPEKLYQFSYFDLTKEQMELIKQVKKEGVALLKGLNNDGIILEHVMTRLMKIQQISNGYFYDSENKKVINIVEPSKNPRIKKMLEVLSQIEGKTLIWTRFTQDINIISEVLNPNEFVTYSGAISQDECRNNKERFIQDPNCKQFILNSQKGATGLTLTVAEQNIYFSNSYDLEVRLQSEDRSHRIGTVNNVVYNDLVANGTPDKKIITSLRKKKNISDLILSDPVGFFLEE